MLKICLIVPTKEHEAQVKEYIEEHNKYGENDIHGGALIEKMPYDDWLLQLKNNSDEKTVNPEWVVSSTFFAIVDGEIIGMIDIRHTLNQFLQDYGGHIGYGVRPTERNKGYAIEMLRLGLAYCKKIALEKVMLTCYKENIASGRTIEKCGGVLEKEFLYSDGKTVQAYWIDI
jgi:predicted acetyltransferase